MSTLVDEAKTVFRRKAVVGDESSADHEPRKAEIIALFGRIDSVLQAMSVAGGVSVAKATRSALYGDLAHAAGVLAIVTQDATSDYNGVYLKAGASGSGSWGILFTLPSSFAADLTAAEADIDALQGEVVGARGGAGSIDARLDTMTTATATNTAGLADLTSDVADLVTVAADLDGRVDVLEMGIPGLVAIGADPERPGESPALFSSTLTGEPAARAALDPAGVVGSADGKAYRSSGELIVAPRRAFRLEPGRIYAISAAVRRITNPLDPANDAVELGVQTLGSGKAGSPSTPIVLRTNTSLTVASGRVVLSGVIAGSSGTGVDALWGSGAVYGVPYVRTYGTSHATNIEVIRVEDVTLAFTIQAAL